MVARYGLSDEIYVYINKLKSADFEKTIPYMYVDSAAYVTVGIGHNLRAKGDKLKLPFVVKRFERHAVLGGDTGLPIKADRTVDRAATKEEIQNDYDFLTKHAGLGRFAAEQLAKYTTLELLPNAIEVLFKADVGDAVGVCIDELGTSVFRSMPIPAQAAFIDIAYNCGTFDTFSGHLVPAIKGERQYAKMSMAERLHVAALHCRRGAVNEVRNNAVAQWFLAGAGQSQLVRQ